MQGTPSEIFEHAEALLKMGLNVPEITKVFMKLKKKGYALTSVYTVEDAVKQLQPLIGGNAP
jgi:hypothetical protein